jgi:flagellar biosynthetic protein FliR
MPILNLPIEEIQNLLLIFTRVTGIFLTAPVLNSARVPLHMKIGLSVTVAMILGPIVKMTAAIPIQTLPFAALVLKEAVVGLSIGFVANLVFTAVQMAGELADMQSGFAFAGMVDPNTGQRTSIIGQFQIMMAWLIFLGVDGHHVLLSGLTDSFRVMPPGSISVNAEVVSGIMGLTSRIFVIALQIGAPIMGAVLLGDLAIGLLSRTVPQMNIFVIGFPVKMLLGLVVLLLALPVSLVLERNLVYLMKGAVSHMLSLAAG